MSRLMRQRVTAGGGTVEPSPEGFAQLFPFYFASDAGLVITQAGPSLLRMAPDVRVGTPLPDVFGFKRPAVELAPERLAAFAGSLVVLQHRLSGILMRGQFLATDGVAGWVFLGSPWFVNAEALEASGLDLEDFPPHDSVAELLLFGQTQQMAINDLRLLNERLERKRRQVEETEELYRAAISAANAVPYREDPKRDAFIHVGEGFENLTGCKATEITPARLRALDDRPEGADTESTLRVRAGEATRRRREYRFVTPDGEERWISDASVVINDATGTPQGAVGLLYDITERRRAEAQLRQLANVAANTASAVGITDAKREIQWVNDAFERLTGYSLEDMRGRLLRDIFAGPKTDMEAIDRGKAAMEAGRTFRGEFRLQRKDGGTVWMALDLQPVVDADGAISGFTAVGIDITAIKTYEQRMKQLTGELNAILGVIPDGIVALTARGRFAYCNVAFERLVGRRVEDLAELDASGLDELIGSLCVPGERPARLLELSESEGDMLRFASPARTIARTVRTIKGDSPAAQWRAFYLRDVTRETELDRMKSDFLTTAAHELRTPMSSVHGFAELLVSREFDAETRRTIARTIHRQSALLVQMVNELLDLARIDAGRGRDFAMEVQPLSPIVEETAAALLMPDDPRRVDLVPAAGDSLRVNVDASKLRLAITNVIANAYKYSRGRGAIRLWLPTRISAGRAEVGIRVQDEGAGMTPEQLGRIFDRFYRANPAEDVPGTGLGMTLVKEIVEAMHGSVEVESEFGRGTTVTLWLPVAGT